MKNISQTVIIPAIVAGVVTLGLNALTGRQTSEKSPLDQAEIARISLEALVKTPETIKIAMENLQKKMAEEEEARTLAAIQENKDKIFSATSPQTPNKEAENVIVTFFDYNCGHCKHFAKILHDYTQKNHNVRVIYKDLPIFGAPSMELAKLALAAEKQGKYLEFHLALMASEDRLTLESALKIALSLDLDKEKLEKDAASPEIKAQIEANMELASKLGINGTPASVFQVGKNLSFQPGALSPEGLDKKINPKAEKAEKQAE